MVRAGDVPTVTVLTQNILGGAPWWPWRCRRLATLIRELSPDIIGLQEVKAADASDTHTQAHELAALLPDYEVDFARASTSRRGVGEGVALLHRHGIVERSVHALTLDLGDRMDRRNPRVVLAAQLDVRGISVLTFVTHLSLSHRARRRTLNELALAVAETQARVQADATFVLGDFNAPPGEEALRRLVGKTAESWTDAWAAAHGERSGATWPSPVPWRRIDYVFVQLGAELELGACERVMHGGSDHVGVWACVRARLDATHAAQ